MGKNIKRKGTEKKKKDLGLETKGDPQLCFFATVPGT